MDLNKELTIKDSKKLTLYQKMIIFFLLGFGCTFFYWAGYQVGKLDVCNGKNMVDKNTCLMFYKGY